VYKIQFYVQHVSAAKSVRIICTYKKGKF